MAAEQFTQQLSLIKSSNIDSQESITAVSIIAQRNLYNFYLMIYDIPSNQ